MMLLRGRGHGGRNSIRLPGFDYGSYGDYFVTLCAQDMRCVFGKIVRGRMLLSPLGRLVDEAWRAIPSVHAAVEIDRFVVMPNHLHGIVSLRAEQHDCPRPTLGEVVGRFKTWTITGHARAVAAGRVRSPTWRLWQRGFMDHVIRDERQLHRLRTYIDENPLRWGLDRYHR